MERERLSLGKGLSIYREWETWIMETNVNGQRVRRSLKTRERLKAIALAAQLACDRSILCAERVIERTDALKNRLTDEALREALCVDPRTALHDAVREVLAEQKPVPKRVTCAEAIRDYLTVQKATGNTETHRANVKRQIEMFVGFAGVVHVHEIMSKHVADYLLDVRERQEQGEASVRAKYLIIAKWLRRCVAERIIDRSPAEGLLPKKPARQDVSYYNSAEVASILRAAKRKGSEEAALMATALYAGLRREELHRLEWSDVNLAGRSIRVVNKPGSPTKTRRNRTVPILDQLLPYLTRLSRGDGRVFARWNDLWAMGEHAKRIVKAATGRDDGLQIARHTCATWLLVAGVSTKIVADWLGNSPAVLESNYAGNLPLGAEPLVMSYSGARLESHGLPSAARLATRRTR